MLYTSIHFKTKKKKKCYDIYIVFFFSQYSGGPKVSEKLEVFQETQQEYKEVKMDVLYRK